MVTRLINYCIPDFYGHYHVNIKLLELIKFEPDLFYNDFKIDAVFGNFPNCIWNGGGNDFGCFIDEWEQTYYLNKYAEYGVPLRLTMTNPILEEKHLYDSYANFIMKNMNNGTTQVLVSSPILEQYIRETYPEYSIVRSIIAAENVYYDNSDKYFMSVLRKSKNTDFELLKSIKNKNKIELLANETCNEDCSRVYSHYNEYAKKQIFDEYDKNLVNCSCRGHY